MDCTTVQMELLKTDGKPTSEAAARHVKSCSECAAFRQTLVLLNAPAATCEPSHLLDDRIRRIAARRSRQDGEGYRFRILPSGHARQAWLAVAALLVFAAFLSVVWLRHPAFWNADEDAGSSAPVAVDQKMSLEEEMTLLYAEMELMQIRSTVVASDEPRQWWPEEGIPSDRELVKAIQHVQEGTFPHLNGS